MSFFNRRPMSARQKAQALKTRLLFRVVALGFIIFYVIVPMFDPNSELAQEAGPTMRYIAGAIFSALIIAIGVLTVREYLHAKKNGLFDEKAYTDDDDVAAPQNESDADDSSDVLDDDYYDDDDYDDEDYDDDDDDYDEDYDDDDEDDEEEDDYEDDEE